MEAGLGAPLIPRGVEESCRTIRVALKNYTEPEGALDPRELGHQVEGGALKDDCDEQTRNPFVQTLALSTAENRYFLEMWTAWGCRGDPRWPHVWG